MATELFALVFDLRLQAASLQSRADGLKEAALQLERIAKAPPVGALDLPKPKRKRKKTKTATLVFKGPKPANGRPSRAEGGRLGQLTLFLEQHGPLARGDISKRSGIPLGSLDALLSRGGFRRDDAGKWSVQ